MRAKKITAPDPARWKPIKRAMQSKKWDFQDLWLAICQLRKNRYNRSVPVQLKDIIETGEDMSLSRLSDIATVLELRLVDLVQNYERKEIPEGEPTAHLVARKQKNGSWTFQDGKIGISCSDLHNMLVYLRQNFKIIRLGNEKIVCERKNLTGDK